MKTKILLLMFALTLITASANENPNRDGMQKKINLGHTNSTNTHIMVDEPVGEYNTATGTLSISVDAAHYASYSVTLTSPSGRDTTVNATSSTVTIPVTGSDDVFIVTVDGGDYGTYDGILSRSGASTATLTDQQALRLVKNRRNHSNGAEFYSATVKTIVNDSLWCPIATPPSQTWLCDTTVTKWLIISCDKTASAAPPECVYQYVTKNISTSDTVPYVFVNGFGVTNSITLRVMNSEAMQHRVFFPNQNFTATQLEAAAKNRVIIFGSGGYYPFQDGGGYDVYIRRWNECAALYNIMTQRFGIPKSNIQVIFPDHRNDIIINPPLSNDFDNDGLDDFDGTLTLNGAISSLKNIPDGQIDQLLIYYANSWGTPTMSHIHDQTIELPIQLEDTLRNVKRISFILSCGNGSAISNDYYGMRSISLSGTYNGYEMEPHSSHDIFAFPFYWLSALAGKDIFTDEPLPITVDTNFDGLVNSYELYDAADDFATIEQNETSCDYDLFLLRYPSVCDWHWRFGYRAYDMARLEISRSSLAEAGSVNWSSPDIWVRAADDGLTFQRSGSFRVVQGQQVYTYVKVTNTGIAPYPGGSRVHLFWEPLHVGIPGEYADLPISMPDNYTDCWVPQMPHRITEFALDDTIMPGASVILKHCWTIPDSVANVSQSFGRIFAANMGAMISGYSYNELSAKATPIPMREMVVTKNQLTLNPALLPLANPNGGMAGLRNRNGKITIPLYGDNPEQPFKLCLLPDSTSAYHSLFSNTDKKMYWRLHPEEDNHSLDANDYYHLTQDTYDTNIYYLNDATASISNFFEGNFCYDDNDEDIDFGLKFTNYLGVGNIDQRLHFVLRDTAQCYTEGFTIEIVEDSISGGGNSGPGILMSRGTTGEYQLTAVNIAQSAHCQWLDGELTPIADGETVAVRRDEVGDVCVLKVTPSDGGADAYAVATLDGTPTIEHLSPVPLGDFVSVSLTGPAAPDMCVRITSVNNQTTFVEECIEEGESETMLNTSALPNGQYIISLIQNGNIVQSVNVIK